MFLYKQDQTRDYSKPVAIYKVDLLQVANSSLSSQKEFVVANSSFLEVNLSYVRGGLFSESPLNKLGRQRKKQQSLINVRMVAKGV